MKKQHDECDPPLSLLLVVATQNFLQGWNIALIVIGAVAFVIGDGIAAFLGTMLAMSAYR